MRTNERIKKEIELINKLKPIFDEVNNNKKIKWNITKELSDVVNGLVEWAQQQKKVAYIQKKQTDDSGDGWDDDGTEKKSDAQVDAEFAVQFTKKLAKDFKDTAGKITELESELKEAKDEASFKKIEEEANTIFEQVIEAIKNLDNIKPNKQMLGRIGELNAIFKKPSVPLTTGAVKPVEENPVSNSKPSSNVKTSDVVESHYKAVKAPEEQKKEIPTAERQQVEIELIKKLQTKFDKDKIPPNLSSFINEIYKTLQSRQIDLRGAKLASHEDDLDETFDPDDDKKTVKKSEAQIDAESAKKSEARIDAESAIAFTKELAAFFTDTKEQIAALEQKLTTPDPDYKDIAKEANKIFEQAINNIGDPDKYSKNEAVVSGNIQKKLKQIGKTIDKRYNLSSSSSSVPVDVVRQEEKEASNARNAAAEAIAKKMDDMAKAAEAAKEKRDAENMSQASKGRSEGIDDAEREPKVQAQNNEDDGSILAKDTTNDNKLQDRESILSGMLSKRLVKDNSTKAARKEEGDGKKEQQHQAAAEGIAQQKRPRAEAETDIPTEESNAANVISRAYRGLAARNKRNAEDAQQKQSESDALREAEAASKDEMKKIDAAIDKRNKLRQKSVLRKSVSGRSRDQSITKQSVGWAEEVKVFPIEKFISAKNFEKALDNISNFHPTLTGTLESLQNSTHSLNQNTRGEVLGAAQVTCGLCYQFMQILDTSEITDQQKSLVVNFCKDGDAKNDDELLNWISDQKMIDDVKSLLEKIKNQDLVKSDWLEENEQEFSADQNKQALLSTQGRATYIEHLSQILEAASEIARKMGYHQNVKDELTQRLSKARGGMTRVFVEMTQDHTAQQTNQSDDVKDLDQQDQDREYISLFDSALHERPPQIFDLNKSGIILDTEQLDQQGPEFENIAEINAQQPEIESTKQSSGQRARNEIDEITLQLCRFVNKFAKPNEIDASIQDEISKANRLLDLVTAKAQIVNDHAAIQDYNTAILEIDNKEKLAVAQEFKQLLEDLQGKNEAETRDILSENKNKELIRKIIDLNLNRELYFGNVNDLTQAIINILQVYALYIAYKMPASAKATVGKESQPQADTNAEFEAQPQARDRSSAVFEGEETSIDEESEFGDIDPSVYLPENEDSSLTSNLNIKASSQIDNDSEDEEKAQEPDENLSPNIPVEQDQLKPRNSSTKIPSASLRNRGSSTASSSSTTSDSSADEEREPELDDIFAATSGFNVPPQANISFKDLKAFMLDKDRIPEDRLIVDNVYNEIDVLMQEQSAPAASVKHTKILTVSEGDGLATDGKSEVAKFSIPQSDKDTIYNGLFETFRTLRYFKEEQDDPNLEYSVPINFNPNGNATEAEILERARCFFQAYWDIFKTGKALEYHLTIVPDEDTRLAMIAVLNERLQMRNQNESADAIIALRKHFQETPTKSTKLGRKPPITSVSPTQNRNASLLLPESKTWRNFASFSPRRNKFDPHTPRARN